MKLIRLTDDRYILDAGPDIRPADMDALREQWTAWFEKNLTAPEVFIIGGVEVKLEFEDRREPDIEARLKRLEEHWHHVGLIDRSAGPEFTAEAPLTGIEQYQAEDR